MKKLVSCALSLSMICSTFAGLTISAKAEGDIVFTHQNVVGSQTCYANDTAEKTITEIPQVIQGMRINQPVFRAKNLTANKEYNAVQKLKDDTILKSEKVTADANGVVEFKHIRNCEMIEILDGASVIASLGTEKTYTNGVMITSAPMSWQVYQRDANNKAVVTIKGVTETDSTAVSVVIDNGTAENVAVTDKAFTYTKELETGTHTITVKSGNNVVAVYENVAVGDVWVAAGQSNMTDMGAITDSYVPDTSDPINDNMHIIYAEDVTWQRMSHPAGEGRFFKTGVRTSPVTSFAREISASECVPVGIVQSSVGGTNIYQWISGVRDSDANSGYLIKALESCFDKMPSHRVKGILWYQGCNDAISESYAYNYKNLEEKLFNEMRSFFGKDTPIITTQINDANQDSTSSLGYYDAWSFVKDVQRQNPDFFDNVYVIGTSDLELGDTIHNSASENRKVGTRWANVAKNVVYGHNNAYGQPTVDSVTVTGKNEVTVSFKNTSGLKAATGTKRIGITNVSGGGVRIAFGDLKKEFVVRNGASAIMTASNSVKGTELTITNAVIDGTSVVLTTEEELSAPVAVDCMYGKRFTPTLVDSTTNESVLAFFNVIADNNGIIADPEKPENMFGSEFNEIKPFTTASLPETAVGDTGFKVSTESSNYNNVAVMSMATKGGTGYYPYGAGLPDNGCFLFFGAGGNGNVSATLTLPEAAAAGSYITITYAKPYATNNGGTNRSAGNANTMKIGTETIDVQATSDYDKWYTKTVKADSAVSKIDITLGKWSALAISSVKVSADAPAETEAPTAAPTTAPTSVPTTAPTASPSGDGAVYTFGSAYAAIKDFTTAVLSETAVGSTGFKISTSGSNYNNVVVRDKNSINSGYFPYGKGLPENGYYLFVGAGGNGAITSELTLPAVAAAGKYVRITYAKPKATNNGSAFRNEVNNDNTLTVGGETIDLKKNCEFDTWYTTTVKASEVVSKLSLKLGSWSAIAISKIEIAGSADMLTLSAADTEKYILNGQTVQYTANVYKSMTTLMGGTDAVFYGSADTAAVTWSVNGYKGVSIDANGLLTISDTAEEGTVTVTAAADGVTKTANLVLKPVSDANGVKIAGDEMVKKGGTLNLKAIPTVGGEAMSERATVWSIEGEALGCTINNGVLTAGSTAGNITVKAVLAVEGNQTTANVSDTFKVTVRDDSITSPYTIKGAFLKNCAADLTAAEGVDGIAIDTDKVSSGYKAVVKAVDANGITLASTEAALDNAAAGVSEINTPITFKNAAEIRAYIINSSSEIVSQEIYKTTKTMYKNIPLVSDWITGAKSGLGMGAGVLKPTGAPYGVDPDTVDVADLNVSYTYDGNYPAQTVNNALWYKTGAYLAQSGNSSNNIYDMHAADWEQKALPIGNGYMAGMLFGLPDKDQIQFNEETFWAAGYRGVQSSVKPNNVNKNMSEGINGYMSVGNIFVDFNMPKGAKVNNYYRDLDLDDSVAHVNYEYNGVKYSREYFASYPKEVLVFRYTADQSGALSFDVNPVLMHPGDATVKDGEITIIGKLKDSESYASGGKAEWNQESDLEYCTKIKVIADDGTVTDGYNTVNVSGATGVTIIVAAATDYDKDQFAPADKDKIPYKSTRGVQAAIDKATARMNGAAAMSYDELKAEHTADYHKQFGTVKFTLTGDKVCQTPTDELQKSYDKVISGSEKVTYNEAAYKALDKHLEELHYNYARYMMISSSRSTTMPANLQGKWCQSTAEIWGSCYCININMEMNYWFAGGANLLDSGKSLIGWFNSQIPAGTITAKNYYGVTPKSYSLNGNKITFTDSSADKDDVFIMHTKQSIMGTTDLTGSTSIQSAGNTAWLAYNIWDLYQTTGDKELLANDIYPIMRKMANFYTQYMYTNLRRTTTEIDKYPDGYYYTTWEGRSPEQGPTGEGIKYDLQLVAGMFDYTISAAEILGIDADKVAAWKEIRDHMELPVELGEDGQIKEWKQETKYNQDADGNTLGADNGRHRHISHLVGLYPGTLISRDNPEYIEGAKIVLNNRGDESTGWSCSNKFLLWARTLDGDKALELFRYQLAKRTYSNLFDTHAPFQIDGNFGSAAGVMELLMQSQTGDIYILPALPTVWDSGEISGIKAKNGAEVSIKWENGKATEIKLVPAADGDLTIGYDKGNIAALDGNSVDFTDGKYTIKNAVAGKEYTFTTEAAERAIVSLTDKHVTVTGQDGDALIVAGYDEKGRLIKTVIPSSLDTDISGFEGCAVIKAMLWNSLSGMIPYAYKEYKITN